jgi:hypothetical protein
MLKIIFLILSWTKPSCLWTWYRFNLGFIWKLLEKLLQGVEPSSSYAMERILGKWNIGHSKRWL